MFAQIDRTSPKLLNAIIDRKNIECRDSYHKDSAQFQRFGLLKLRLT